MDYISREKWVEICQIFFEAYVKFRLEGTEEHWFELNDRNIEIAFFDHGDFLTVKMYCPDVLKGLSGYYNNSAQDTEEILRMLLWLAFDAEFDAEGVYTYEIETSDSEKACEQIIEILLEMESQSFNAFIDGIDLQCIIEIYGRKIAVQAIIDDNETDTDFSLECINTGRKLVSIGWWEGCTLEDVVQRILYLALEPECFKITATNYESEYELIRAIVVYAIEVCPPCCILEEAQERIIELHGRQIKIQFITRYRDKTKLMPKERLYYVNASLTCITTGKSCSCDVEAFDKNPKELVWKIQELAWEDV